LGGAQQRHNFDKAALPLLSIKRLPPLAVGYRELRRILKRAACFPFNKTRMIFPDVRYFFYLKDGFCMAERLSEELKQASVGLCLAARILRSSDGAADGAAGKSERSA
jgi:hypothetical protein